MFQGLQPALYTLQIIWKLGTISSTVSSWVTIHCLMQSGFAFYQLLDDWVVNIEETAEEIGTTQKSDDKAEGIAHRK